MSSIFKIGLFLDTMLLPAWAYTAIERVIYSNAAQLDLVILNQSAAQKTSTLSTFWENRKHWLYTVFNFVDEGLFLHGSIATERIDASKLLINVPILEVTPISQNETLHLSGMDIEKIKSYRLDILFRLGFDNLCGDVLTASSKGIWSYRWGDILKIEDGLTGFWEAVERWPETGASLQQLAADPEGPRTLFQSWFSTYPYSPARNRNRILWSSSSFLSRQIERIHCLDEGNFSQDLPKNNVDKLYSSRKPNEVPSNITVLWIMARLVLRNLLEMYSRFFYREHWELLVNLDKATENNIAAYKKISPPRECFWADPHVVYREPNYFIFVEELSYRSKRGHISVIEVDDAGNYKNCVPVLEKEYHLSFPSVFEWTDHFFMIPESAENKTIDLYECTSFPREWQFKISLMRGVTAVDTNLLHFQGKWWLFTAIAEQEAAAPQFELFLFYSDELFTDHWQPHPMNPIVSDVKKARAAGRIFEKDGKLFRPSQNCSRSYGYGFDINEIVTLSESDYCERTVSSVRPTWTDGIIGTHTFASDKNITVIDILTRQFRWS